MNNLPLFDDDHAELGKLLDNLDAIPENELQSRWSQVLADIVDLFCAELVRQGHYEQSARHTASQLVSALSYYHGGRAVYLPTDNTFKAAIRDNLLFIEWSRESRGDIDALAKKYGLTNHTVYAILRQQLALHRKRHQPDLF